MRNACISIVLPLMMLAACATTNGASYTAEERASCVEMERDMGTGTVHDHNAMKGMGMNPMNISHKRCQEILAQPQQ